MTDAQQKYSAPALEKGLDIIELLANEPDGISKTEIAQRLDRTISEIFRMLVVLERRGFIEFNEGDKCTLSLKLFELSHRYSPVRRLSSVSGEIMKRLAFDLGQSCHMVVYHSGRGHVVAQQDPPTDLVFSVRLGAEVKLFGTCSGNILLAYSDDVLREKMVADIPANHPVPTAKGLAAMVERVRQQGYESMDSPRTGASSDIGFPIFDHSGDVVATLVVPYLSLHDNPQQLTKDEVRETLAVASQQISLALGYNPES